MNSLRTRLLLALVLLVVVLTVGVVGYMAVEGWGAFDSLYMTVISLTTVGYGEVRDLSRGGRIFTIFLLFSGMGILAYGVGTLTAFLVEGHLSDILRGRKMQMRIQRLRDHFILCGIDGEGHYVLEELIKTKTPFVVVAKDTGRIKEIFPDEDILCVEADPTKETTLSQANIANARGLISALSTDSENLLVVLSARELSPALRIISCVYDRENQHKFRRVGANGTVMGTFIGGLRMVSEAIRPTVVTFLDAMLREEDKTIRIEEIALPAEGCDYAGMALKEAHLPSKTGLIVIAVKPVGSPKYLYNPKGDYILRAGDVLIVIGGVEQILQLKKLLGYRFDEEEGDEEGEAGQAPAESTAASG